MPKTGWLKPTTFVAASHPHRLEFVRLGLQILRDADAVLHGLRRIGQEQRIRVERKLVLGNKRPAARRNRFNDFDADVRLAHAVGTEPKSRAPVRRIPATSTEKVTGAGGEVRIEWRAMGLVRAAHIDRAVERHAVPAQPAARQQEIRQAGTGIRRRRRRPRLGRNRHIRRIRRAGESENHRRGNNKLFHCTPLPQSNPRSRVLPLTTTFDHHHPLQCCEYLRN